ncbi:MAG: membrane protein [Alphaproteobacteria bacterium]|nr:MAG: membrane protein [Alphaproteobacteria bacterium]
MPLDSFVIALVLMAAVMHASWNALVKSGRDKTAMLVLVITASSIPAMAMLPFVPPPDPAAWPYLAASTAIHFVYYLTLVSAYRHGDLSQAYPIARGSSPVIVAVGAWLLAGETQGLLQILGIAIASAGIISLAGSVGVRNGKLAWNGSGRDGEGKSIAFAFATSVAIAFYTLMDGLGVRSTADPMSYILWLLALEGPLMVAAGLWLRRGRLVESYRPVIGKGIVGGLVAGLGYGIVIWAMNHVPMAHVSMLRETSVILAAAIGALFLGEPFGARRIAAAALVAAGNALLHLQL